MERVRHGEGDRDRDQADDEARAQLAEMLDERRLLAVAQAPRKQAHRVSCRVGGGESSAAGRGSSRLVVVLAGDRVLELAHPAAERAADLGQALRPEDQQRHDAG